MRGDARRASGETPAATEDRSRSSRREKRSNDREGGRDERGEVRIEETGGEGRAERGRRVGSEGCVVLLYDGAAWRAFALALFVRHFRRMGLAAGNLPRTARCRRRRAARLRSAAAGTRGSDAVGVGSGDPDRYLPSPPRRERLRTPSDLFPPVPSTGSAAGSGWLAPGQFAREPKGAWGRKLSSYLGCHRINLVPRIIPDQLGSR